MIDFKSQAESLLMNDAFMQTISKARADALEGLATCDPTDTDAIRQYQATVSVIDDMMSGLKSKANQGQGKKPGLA